jgi:putative SOS response-associated peptidase YedK
MCNVHSQATIRDWFRAKHDRTGNLLLFPGIFLDQFAPIVRTRADGERELVLARWGMPGPAAARSFPHSGVSLGCFSCVGRCGGSARRAPALAAMTSASAARQ